MVLGDIPVVWEREWLTYKKGYFIPDAGKKLYG